MNEEDAFWALVYIVEVKIYRIALFCDVESTLWMIIVGYNCGGSDYKSFQMQVVMPQNYYSKQMVGAQVDQVTFYVISVLIFSSSCFF